LQAGASRNFIVLTRNADHLSEHVDSTHDVDGIKRQPATKKGSAVHVASDFERLGNLHDRIFGSTDAGKLSLDRTFLSNLLTYGGISVLEVVLTQARHEGKPPVLSFHL
jgi:hypothetical protein